MKQGCLSFSLTVEEGNDLALCVPDPQLHSAHFFKEKCNHEGDVSAGPSHLHALDICLPLLHLQITQSLTHEEQEAWELKWVRARKRERLWMNPGSRAQQELSESASGHAKPRRGAKLQYECRDDHEEMKRGFALLAGIKIFLIATPKLVA